MRHVGTLLASIVVGPLAWVLLALGQQRSAAAFAGADRGALHPGDFVRPLLLLTAAGLLLGILGTLRFSPLGAMVIGVLYTLSNTMLLVAPYGVLHLITDNLTVAGRHVDLAGPIRSGTTMVLGVLMLVGAISVQRWRPWPRAADPAADPATGDRRAFDGAEPFPPYERAEPRLNARSATSGAPYDTNTPAWPDAIDDPAGRRGTSVNNAPYGW